MSFVKNKQFVKNSYLQKSIAFNLELQWSDLLILICSIIISSVGLGDNNSAIIVGSMLISPLMDPLLGIGYGLTNSFSLFKKGIRLLVIQVLTGVTISFAYFFIIPNATVNEAIISRTSVTFGVLIVAFFGGLSAIIGTSKKDAGNILPGVAIAASLMPPLSTIGFGIATVSIPIIIGSAILFLSNIGLIILGIFLGSIFVNKTQKK